MTEVTGGALWFLIDVVLVAILAAALIYGTIQWRKRSRNPAVERASENATRDMYDAPKR